MDKKPIKRKENKPQPGLWIEPIKPAPPEKIQHTHDVLPHILAFGPAGVGKTLICELIAHKLSKQYKRTVTLHTKIAGQLKSASDVENLVKKIEYGDVVLIDEIHSLKLPIEEILYSALQDFIYYPINDTLQIENYSLRLENKDNTNIIKIPKCTFLAATTTAGGVSRPLRERFQIEVELERLDESLLSEIAINFNRVKTSKSFQDYKGQNNVIRLIYMHINSLDKTPNKITKEAADEIARRSLGTPRLTNNFRLHASCRAGELDKTSIDLKDVKYALDLIGVDKNGLHPVDRRLIKYLLERDNKPSGINALAAVIGASPSDVREIIVPRMSAAGILTRDSRSWIILSNQGIKNYKNLNFTN
jgi:holliday junction DNA helicase RuvB